MKPLLSTHRIILTIIMAVMVLILDGSDAVIFTAVYAVLMILTIFIDELYQKLLSELRFNIIMSSYMIYRNLPDTQNITMNEFIERAFKTAGVKKK